MALAGRLLATCRRKARAPAGWPAGRLAHQTAAMGGVSLARSQSRQASRRFASFKVASLQPAGWRANKGAPVSPGTCARKQHVRAPSNWRPDETKLPNGRARASSGPLNQAESRPAGRRGQMCPVARANCARAAKEAGQINFNLMSRARQLAAGPLGSRRAPARPQALNEVT